MKKYSILIFNWILLYVLIKKLIKNSKTAQYEHLSVIFNFFYKQRINLCKPHKGGTNVISSQQRLKTRRRRIPAKKMISLSRINLGHKMCARVFLAQGMIEGKRPISGTKSFNIY
jgi:hypothetical protein